MQDNRETGCLRDATVSDMRSRFADPAQVEHLRRELAVAKEAAEAGNKECGLLADKLVGLLAAR